MPVDNQTRNGVVMTRSGSQMMTLGPGEEGSAPSCLCMSMSLVPPPPLLNSPPDRVVGTHMTDIVDGVNFPCQSSAVGFPKLKNELLRFMRATKSSSVRVLFASASDRF
jgi:hypothetical protein